MTHLNVGAPWSGCPSANVIDHVLAGCSRNTAVPLLVFDDGVSVGRVEFRTLLERFAATLRDHIGHGDRVGIALSNRVEYFVALFAVIACRGVAVSMDPGAKEHDAGFMLADALPKVLIVQPDNHALFAGLIARSRLACEVIVVGEDEPNGLTRAAGEARDSLLLPHDGHRDDITAIYYTSGTTGTPKGCMVDHTWWLRIVDVDLRMNPAGRERALCSTPFFYADPAIYLMMILQVGGTLVAMRRFTVSRYWDIVHRFDVTKIHAIASIPVLIAKAPPHPLERANRVHHATSAAVPTHLHGLLVQRFGFPWLDNYGATETGMMCRMPWHMRDEMVGSGSIGVVNPEVELRIVDAQGIDVADGTEGEALIKAPGMFKGYLNRPDATADALRDGWYQTGDLVRRDGRGFVYFVGRKKDIVRRSGQNIAAAEVEAVLRMIPSVKDVAVVAVPDEVRGEEVKAHVQLIAGVTPADLTPEMIVSHCVQQLAAFKIPRYVVYRSIEFPRTPSMRVAKQMLIAEQADAASACWDREA